LSDPHRVRRLTENFAQEGGSRGASLGQPPPLGEKRGRNLTTTRDDFLNNSLIEDFSRLKKKEQWIL